MGVERIHIVVQVAAARLVFALPGFLDATVHLSDFELSLERDRLTIILIRPLYICHTSVGTDSDVIQVDPSERKSQNL